MPTPSPQEKGESTSIPHNTVVTTAPPVGNDVTNKETEATSSKGKEAVDAEAQTKIYKNNDSLEESCEFLRLFRKRDFKITDQ